MGRYYEGDINGKFMFGVQASNAADRFGVEGNTLDLPERITIEDVEERISIPLYITK